MTLPTLYHKGKGGAIYQWRVWTEDDTIYTEYGQVGGQLQVTHGKRCEGKNVGKKNQTTPAQQALSEAEALHTFKLERKYSMSPKEATVQLFLPMLAHPIEKVKDLSFPASVQPKMDGVRCLAYWADGQVQLMSRSGKPYSVPHISEQLSSILGQDMILDGELYRHGVACQTITSWVKRAQPETIDIQYWVYDMPMVDGADDLIWQRRLNAMDRLLPDLGGSIIRVPTSRIVDRCEIQDKQREYIELGFEGLMYRAMEGQYEWGYRSRHLLKVKDFQDAEFVIVGARDGHGKYEGCVVWQCQNDLTDAIFEVAPACSMEERARLWRDHEQYIGKRLTVKFFDRTEAQVPRFPVGKLIRMDEDLG